MTLHIYYCPSCDSFLFKTGEAMAVAVAKHCSPWQQAPVMEPGKNMYRW